MVPVSPKAIPGLAIVRLRYAPGPTAGVMYLALFNDAQDGPAQQDTMHSFLGVIAQLGNIYSGSNWPLPDDVAGQLHDHSELPALAWI